MIGNVRWSPDGSKIVFTQSFTIDPNASSGRSQSDILVVDADGFNEKRLTDTSLVREHSPVWSPDGTKIAFERYLVGDVKKREIWLMNPDGSGERRLSDVCDTLQLPVWSPDGARVSFHGSGPLHGDGSSGGGGSCEGIYLVNTDGSEPTSITGFTGAQPHHSWSPDGIWIAFIDRRHSQVNIVRADGSEMMRVTGDIIYGKSYPSWSTA